MGVRVLIVEDHALLAQSLAFALRAEGMAVEISPVGKADDIMATVHESAPDIVLLDFDIGGELGFSTPLIRPIQETGARVVMLTGVTDRVRLAECLEVGAIGVISKSEAFDRLVDAVKDSIELGTLMTAQQRDALMAELRRQRAEDRARLEVFERLTPRERQVLTELMDGKSADTIASEWVVSLATVRSQIRSLLMKLGVNSQLAAVSLARRAGWSPEE